MVQRIAKMKEATEIVVNGEPGLNLAAKAFLLINRRFHCLRRQIGNAREHPRAANSWTTRRDERRRRLESVRRSMQGPILSQEKIIDALELLLKSGDRVVLE